MFNLYLYYAQYLYYYSLITNLYFFRSHYVYFIYITLYQPIAILYFIIFRFLDFTILLYSYNWYYFTNSLFPILLLVNTFIFQYSLLWLYYLNLQWLSLLFSFLYLLYDSILNWIIRIYFFVYFITYIYFIILILILHLIISLHSFTYTWFSISYPLKSNSYSLSQFLLLIYLV